MASSTTTILRLITALAVIWVGQFGIVIWFMVGQGYDRSTAAMVPWAALALLPFLAWCVRAGLDPVEGSRVRRSIAALLQAAALYAAGILIPARVIVSATSMGSPFQELWWILGTGSVILAGMLFHIKAPRRQRAPYALALLLGSAVSLPLLRAFVFSFFR